MLYKVNLRPVCVVDTLSIHRLIYLAFLYEPVGRASHTSTLFEEGKLRLCGFLSTVDVLTDVSTA